MINCPRFCTLTSTDDDVDGKPFNALIQFPHIIHSVPRKRVHRPSIQQFSFFLFTPTREGHALSRRARLIIGRGQVDGMDGCTVAVYVYSVHHRHIINISTHTWCGLKFYDIFCSEGLKSADAKQKDTRVIIIQSPCGLHRRMQSTRGIVGGWERLMIQQIRIKNTRHGSFCDGVKFHLNFLSLWPPHRSMRPTTMTVVGRFA